MKTNQTYRSIARRVLRDLADDAPAMEFVRELHSRTIVHKWPEVRNGSDLLKAVSEYLEEMRISTDPRWSPIEAARRIEKLNVARDLNGVFKFFQTHGGLPVLGGMLVIQIAQESTDAVVTSTLACAIDMADAQQRLQLAHALLIEAQPLVPRDVLDDSPGHIADDLPRFLKVIEGARRQLKGELFK